MTYKVVKNQEAFQVSKVGIDLAVFPALLEVGVVLGECNEGHNQEFYHEVSTFTYVVYEGVAIFYLDDEQIEVAAGDMISIEPDTRIYYRGAIKYILLTTPPWTEENEVITREKIW